MEMSKIKLRLFVVLSLCFLGVLILIWGSIELNQSGKEPQSITSSDVAIEILPSPRSPKQWIYHHGNSTKVEVLCDFKIDGGGWTLIQKRSSRPRKEFNKTWNEYSEGFGSCDKTVWIGLENIGARTKDGDQELRIELEDFEGNKRWAKYSSFSTSNASDFYRLSIGGFSGNATDSMMDPSFVSIYNANGMKFSTTLNEAFTCNPDVFGGGWWFNVCGSISNLNCPYRPKGETVSDYKGIFWWTWKNSLISMAKTEM